MAIYHLSMQIISRSKGQSAVSSAAYRSGEKLMDERTGESKFYRREVQPDTMILAPSNSPEWVQDRERLWNEVEKIEKRKDAQLAREINVALPRELSNGQQKELIKNYIQEQFVDKGMIADIAIHRDDLNNPHAHIMLTTREITVNGFGPKNRDWNDRGLIDIWRKEWANYANEALEKEGIQERITHLSHEARGIEFLPTVHLGHVAYEMEERGIQTDRGNINRERQEYNQIVVELDKYREEKKALEQEKKRQQEQNQKLEKFYTPAEQIYLKGAAKILKTEPTLQNILNRYVQLDKWNMRVDKNDGYIRWKDKSIKEASEQFRSIHSFENQIQEAEKQIDNINWFNPLKLKENNMTKEKAERDITKAKGEIEFHLERLKYYGEKLGFSTEEEFNHIKGQYEVEMPGLLKRNEESRKRIRYERNMLQKAENAHKKAFVRQVASLYPERPEMQYMKYENALKLVELNSKYGKGQVLPIEDIKKHFNNRKQEIQRLQKEISHVELTKSRLQRAEAHLKEYEKYQAIAQRYENNPFLKGRTIMFKSARQEYNEAVMFRDHYLNKMQKEGISGRDNFKKQVDELNKMEVKVPEFKEQIKIQEIGFSLFDVVINALQQAEREMTKDRNHKQQEMKGKKKKRWNREIGW